MRKPATIASTASALIVGAIVLSGCATHPTALPTQTLPASPVADQPTTSATPTGPATPTPSATPATPTASPSPTRPVPLFGTPQAAMAYMAAAFDARDMTALRKVTTPESRKELFDMWPHQVHLRLASCDKVVGGYVCNFPHDPPKGMDPTAVPVATMLVRPADAPGWYLSQIIECG